MKNLALSVVGTPLLVSVAVPSRAHHSFAVEFDPSKSIQFEGHVTEMEWINQHSCIDIGDTGPDGKVVNWMGDGGTPNALLRRAFTKAALPAGTEIVIERYQAKDGSNRANGRDITFVDGRKLWVADHRMTSNER